MLSLSLALSRHLLRTLGEDIQHPFCLPWISSKFCLLTLNKFQPFDASVLLRGHCAQRRVVNGCPSSAPSTLRLISPTPPRRSAGQGSSVSRRRRSLIVLPYSVRLHDYPIHRLTPRRPLFPSQRFLSSAMFSSSPSASTTTNACGSTSRQRQTREIIVPLSLDDDGQCHACSAFAGSARSGFVD